MMEVDADGDSSDGSEGSIDSAEGDRPEDGVGEAHVSIQESLGGIGRA